MALSSPVSPRDLGLKEKKFQSINDAEAAYNILVRRLNETYKYNRRDHDRLTEDVGDVSAHIICKIRMSGNQNAPYADTTKIDLDTVIYDDDSWADTENNRINIPESGTYLIKARVGVHHGASVDETIALAMTTRGAGTGISVLHDIGVDVNVDGLMLSDVVELTSDDYIELWITNFDAAIDWSIQSSLVSTSLTVVQIK